MLLICTSKNGNKCKVTLENFNIIIVIITSFNRHPKLLVMNAYLLHLNNVLGICNETLTKSHFCTNLRKLPFDTEFLARTKDFILSIGKYPIYMYRA